MPKIGLSYDDILLKPNYSEIMSRLDVDLTTNVTKNHKMNLPVISANMDTVTEFQMAATLDKYGGLGVLHRFCPIPKQIDMVRKLKENNNSLIAASIGVTDEFQKRLESLVGAGIDIVCIDIAHGHHFLMKKTIQLCKQFDIDIIAGNIATKKAAKFLCEQRVDAIKVGIGPGSMCTTRINTGFGVPQVTAIERVKSVTREYDVPIIADGGIKNSGDIAKALAAGANSIMSGSLFAGCKETPGIIHKEGNFPEYTLYKQYRGSASLDSKVESGKEKRNLEGISTRVEYKGPAKYVMQNIEDGLRSAFSYAGAINIEEYHKKVKYVRQTAPEKV